MSFNTGNVKQFSQFKGEQGEVIDGMPEEIEQGEGVAVDPEAPASNQDEKPTRLEQLKGQDPSKLVAAMRRALDSNRKLSDEQKQLNDEKGAVRSAIKTLGLSTGQIAAFSRYAKLTDDELQAEYYTIRICMEAVGRGVQVDFVEESLLSSAQIELQKVNEQLEKRQAKLDEVNKSIKNNLKKLNRLEKDAEAKDGEPSDEEEEHSDE